MVKRGEDGISITTFLQFFLSHNTEKLRRGTFLFHTEFLQSKYFMDKRRGVKAGGVSRYCVKNFLSQSTEKLRTGNLLFFYKKSGIEKIHG